MGGNTKRSLPSKGGNARGKPAKRQKTKEEIREEDTAALPHLWPEAEDPFWMGRSSVDPTSRTDADKNEYDNAAAYLSSLGYGGLFLGLKGVDKNEFQAMQLEEEVRRLSGMVWEQWDELCRNVSQNNARLAQLIDRHQPELVVDGTEAEIPGTEAAEPDPDFEEPPDPDPQPGQPDPIPMPMPMLPGGSLLERGVLRSFHELDTVMATNSEKASMRQFRAAIFQWTGRIHEVSYQNVRKLKTRTNAEVARANGKRECVDGIEQLGLLSEFYKGVTPRISSDLRWQHYGFLAPHLTHMSLACLGICRFILSRTEAHPSTFARLDHETTHMARAARVSWGGVYADGYMILSPPADGSRSAHLAAYGRCVFPWKSQTANLAGAFESAKRRGTAYSIHDGYQILVTQYMIYFFLNECVKYLLRLRLPAPKRDQQDWTSMSQLLPVLRRRGWEVPIQDFLHPSVACLSAWELFFKLSHHVSMEHYWVPERFNTNLWISFWECNIRNSTSQLKLLAGEPHTFTVYLRDEIQYHYGHIRDENGNPLRTVVTEAQLASMMEPEWHLDYINDLVKSALWHTILRLEMVYYFRTALSKLKDAVEAQKIDLENPATELGDSVRKRCIGLQLHIRWFSELLWSDLFRRGSALVGFPEMEQRFERIQDGEGFPPESRHCPIRFRLRPGALPPGCDATDDLAKLCATICCDPKATHFWGWTNILQMVRSIEIHRDDPRSAFANRTVSYLQYLHVLDRMARTLERTCPLTEDLKGLRQDDATESRSRVITALRWLERKDFLGADFDNQRLLPLVRAFQRDHGPPEPDDGLGGEEDSDAEAESVVRSRWRANPDNAPKPPKAEEIQEEEEAGWYIWQCFLRQCTGGLERSMDNMAALVSGAEGIRLGPGFVFYFRQFFQGMFDDPQAGPPQTVPPGGNDGPALMAFGDMDIDGLVDPSDDNNNNNNPAPNQGAATGGAAPVPRHESTWQKNVRRLRQRRRWESRSTRIGAGPLDEQSSRDKLKATDWDTFAILFGKKGSIRFEQVRKAMGHIGYLVSPSKAGSGWTFGKTGTSRLDTGDMSQSFVVHDVHSGKAMASNVTKNMGRRMEIHGITRASLSQAYTGGPNGGWD